MRCYGDVAATAVSGEGSESLALDHTLTAGRSCWVALRAYGKNGGLTHSAPVYVSVDGVQEFWNTTDLLEPVWKAQLPALRQHADRALKRYDEMLQRLE